MKKFNQNEIIELGKKLSKAGFVAEYKPRSHSHILYSLFPQTVAQYQWVKKEAGTTANVIIRASKEEVLKLFPELEGLVTSTASKDACRIHIEL